MSPLRLGANEPAAGPWRVMPLAELAALLLATAGEREGRPAIVAVDGRSSSGKTTLAGRLERVVAGTSIVHTDDIAWWHSRFDWDDLLERGVLEPARRGHAVAFRPPAWDERDRPGAIEVPAGARLLIVEGVGAGRRETAHLVDAIVYVQADLDEAERRTAARVAAGETTSHGVRGWMAEEHPFVAGQRRGSGPTRSWPAHQTSRSILSRKWWWRERLQDELSGDQQDALREATAEAFDDRYHIVRSTRFARPGATAGRCVAER